MSFRLDSTRGCRSLDGASVRTRNIELDAPTEAKILACRDDAVLRAWLARATMAAHASELFDPQ